MRVDFEEGVVGGCSKPLGKPRARRAQLPDNWERALGAPICLRALLGFHHFLSFSFLSLSHVRHSFSFPLQLMQRATQAQEKLRQCHANPHGTPNGRPPDINAMGRERGRWDQFLTLTTLI